MAQAKTSVFADAQSQVSRESKAPHLLIPHASKTIHSQPVNATTVLIFCKQTDCFWLKFLSFLHHKQNSHMLPFLKLLFSDFPITFIKPN